MTAMNQNDADQVWASSRGESPRSSRRRWRPAAIIVGMALVVGLLSTSVRAVDSPAPGPAIDHAAVPKPPLVLVDRKRLWFGGILLFVCGSVLTCSALARAGWPIYVRPIAALEAIDEAVGRATEMGRPMLFVPGVRDLNEVETIAGLTVMSQVARKAAEYDTPLEVPTSRVLVMSAAREVCEAAALAAGRSEAYDRDRVSYISDHQFGYAAHVCGWMVRQRPAACFYLGKFYAESLLFAETGQSVGAIQIAGTAEAAQLPFFVAACDYALIGEELFAASAYLSGEPEQLGTVQGQDLGKFLAIAVIIVGCGIATLAAVIPGVGLTEALRFLTHTILQSGGGG